MIKGHVLIVDDEPSNLHLMEELFHQHGATTVTAQSGEEALALAAERKPDLVLLDIMMPGMNGYEVCRKLKADDATRRIPVVMVTGLGALQDKLMGLEAGADDFLNKPVNAAELLTRSRSLLRVKDLGDELENAYYRLADVATFTNTLLKEFDPYRFQVDHSLRRLMEFLLEPKSGDKTRPRRVVLLGSTPQGGWSGWFYQQSQGVISFRPLPAELDNAQLESIFLGRTVVFCNRGEPEFSQVVERSLWAKLGVPPPEDNLVAYRSGEVMVLAMDFGKQVTKYEAQVLSALVVTIHFFLKTISSQVQEVERAFLYTIGALARAAESHDEDTGNHIVRVNRYAQLIAGGLGCDKEFVRVLGYSAQMHDVGKLHIHPDILRKPGPLDAMEWSQVKLHTVFGVRILGEDPRLAMAREVALNHHEHYDGGGYPQGLVGEEIPLSGRITMLADIYDALRSQRPYKTAFDHDQAVMIILKGDNRLKPGYFDPRVRQAFGDLHKEMERIYTEYNDSASDAPAY
jgi:response regulator RpfG family c-di-GMP phosphodiesterase